MYALLVGGLALIFPSRQVRIRWRSLILRKWAKATAALLKIRITAYGAPPCAPFFLVSNHLSYVDIIVLASQLCCSFIAKKDVARWPVIGLLCKSVGTIFIDRENRKDITRVNGQVEQALAEERGVVLFAEGTSSQGATVLPFKPGLLEPAARADSAVSYAALSYHVPDDETPPHLSVCWWGDMTFIKHLFGLLHLREIYATLIFGRDAIRDGDRKELARRLHAAVKQEFIPVVRSEQEWTTVIL
jgi:1-acyl-sn-glycerol-3-phosphate acyltransferase